MRSAISRRGVRGLVVLGLVAMAGCGGDSPGQPGDPGTLPLESFDAGFFSIDKPRGWDIVTAGSCTEFAFLAQDPAEARRQIFYFGSVGPIYLKAEQKAIDAAYVAAGGYDIPWRDAPVIDPLTPQNYLEHWPEIAAMRAAGEFMARFPPLTGIKVSAVRPQSALVPGATSALMRGLYTASGQVAEGMFLVSVFPFSPFTDTPAGGTGYGYFICGATAPKAEFAARVGRLVESLNSFTVRQSYIAWCLDQSARQWGAVAEAGRTLSEASDIVYEGWQSRSHAEDITSEKYSDAFRGVERVYDPDTGQVYECPNGWYEQYDRNRGSYDMSDLQPLPPDNWDLWMAAARAGEGNIH